ncbi:radical SAM protein [Catellatospora sp. KI3]|uniref:radical SAM protein n=1 Tax=Catellatospora sp. KI3 TaxID=3041620 RepID=UPI0024832A14|nr:radical SAM protein [Catellatospora sp. KI3]MDI1465215.1 radical SAM protein [Catellatospora sp. KI3]
MSGLTMAEAERLRRVPGASLAFFLTDRCPVGCGHCSVSARVDGPTIRDWELFGEVVAGVAGLPELRVVAVTGGDPFVERRGLIHAVGAFAAAGKAVVLFTSGYWARPPVPGWIRQVLELTSTVYLSTDSYHAAAAAGVGPQRLRAAAETVLDAGCHLVLQVLDEPGAIEAARELCPTADLSVIAPLPAGRGSGLFAPAPARPLRDFGRCGLLNSPTVRYDGRVSACCNEAVITGAGPAGLRRQVRTAADLAPALAGFRADPALTLVGRHGPAALSLLVDGPVRTICQACWAGVDRVATDPAALAAATVLAGVGAPDGAR